MKLAWLANLRPNLLFEISQLAQITSDTFEQHPRKNARRLNKAIQYAISNPASICLPKLERSSLRIISYSDAGFGTNADATSQLGRIVIIMDGSGPAVPILFKSYKSRRVDRLILGGEIMAFSDAFDDAMDLRHQLEQALQQKLPLQMLTDSKSLFDVISKGSRTSERRLMIYMASVRE